MFGVKTPPAPPSLHDIMPIMDPDGLEVSVTDALTVILVPDAKELGFTFTEVVVLSSAP